MSCRIRKRPRKRVGKKQLNEGDNTLLIGGVPSNLIQDTTQNQEGDEEGEGSGDGMAVVETYSEYWPAKFKIGLKHPDPVVETGSMNYAV